MSLAAAPVRDGPIASRPRLDALLRTWLPLILILGIAVIERHFVIGNADVSWEITLSEKILDGQRLYTDLIELNPPASVLLHVGIVAVARALGWSPEITVDAAIFLVAISCFGLISHIVRQYRLLDADGGAAFAVFTLAVMTILPAQTFGEREHIALLTVLPLLVLSAARATGVKLLLWHCLVAGAGAGITVCIKPHFAFAVGLAAAAAALHLRSWRTLFALENWIAAAIAIAYAVSVAVFFRPFITDVMPLVAAVYLPVRLSFVEMLSTVPVVLCVGSVLVILGLGRGIARYPLLLMLLAASAGFTVAYLIQGKGWPYQSYPMLALAVIALDLAGGLYRRAAAQSGDRDRFMNLCVTAGFVVVGVWSFAWLNIAIDTRAATAAVERIAPPHPSIAAISDDIAIGHPLSRDVGGRWIARASSLWVTQNAAILLHAGSIDATTAQRLSAYAETERRRVIEEIRNGKPDIILIDERPGRIAVNNRAARWGEWVKADPDLAALVAANYRVVDQADGVAILKRNDR
jgi:hypothetical protein